MDLPDLKALDKIIGLCRKRGVQSVEIGGIKLVFAEETAKPARTRKVKGEVVDNDDGKIESDAPSDEALLFWSTQDPSAETAKES